jgi:hypothetical protein
MKGDHSPVFRSLLDFYLELKIKRGFQQVFFECDQAQAKLNPMLPLLFVSNHVSWWDGFFISELQKRMIPSSSHFTLMLENELKKFPFFRKTGAVGIIPEDSYSVARSFLELRRLRRSLGTLSIAFFPQGKIRPQQCRPLGFQKGLDTLIRLLHPIQVLPVALHIEPMHTPKPTAWVRTGRLQTSGDQPIQSYALEEEILALLKIPDLYYCSGAIDHSSIQESTV